MKPLVDECARYLKANINVDNSAKLLFYSDLYELSELKTRTMDFMFNGHSKEVMQTTGWKEFVKTKPDLMEQIIEEMCAPKPSKAPNRKIKQEF